MNKQPAQKLYLQMKLDIRDNKLPIGELLRQEQLSARYQVSRIPIRDVLQRLKNEGWLTSAGKRGVMIPSLSAEEAEDLYMMRMVLEPLLIGHAIGKVTQQTLGKAADFLDVIDSNETLTVQEHGELNWQFHACLYQHARRVTLFNTVASLHQQCGRYIGFHTKNLNYKTTSQNEHVALLAAIKNKDSDQAKNILREHIQSAGKQLTEYLTHA